MTTDNKYLNRLRQQYKVVKNQNAPTKKLQEFRVRDYHAMRLFCLDTGLVSFNEIEAMEFEIDESLSS